MKILVSLVALCVVVLANYLVGHCAPSQQPSDAQNSISQDSFDTYRVSGSGDDGGILINLAQTGATNGFSGPSNKRARKMSAFIPMRGRKDGRAQGQFGLVPQHLDSDDPSIWHLVGGGGTTGPLLAATSAWLTSAGGPQIVPQQFANQFVAQHAKQQQQQRSSDQPIVLSPPNQRAGGAGRPQQQQSPQAGLGGGADNPEQLVSPLLFNGVELMKAKPRRAFHPMRGKKSTLNPAAFDGGDDDGALLAAGSSADQVADAEGKFFVF